MRVWISWRNNSCGDAAVQTAVEASLSQIFSGGKLHAANGTTAKILQSMPEILNNRCLRAAVSVVLLPANANKRTPSCFRTPVRFSQLGKKSVGDRAAPRY